MKIILVLFKMNLLKAIFYLMFICVFFILGFFYCDFKNEFKNACIYTDLKGRSSKIKIINGKTAFFSIDNSLYIVDIKKEKYNFVISVSDIISDIIAKPTIESIALITERHVYIVNLKNLSVTNVICLSKPGEICQKFSNASFLDNSDIIVGESGLINEISQRSTKTNQILWKFDFSKSSFNLFNKWESKILLNFIAASKNDVYIGFPNGLVSFNMTSKSENGFANLGNNMITGMTFNKHQTILSVSSINKIFVLDKNLNTITKGHANYECQIYSEPLFFKNDTIIGLATNRGCKKGSGISFFSSSSGEFLKFLKLFSNESVSWDASDDDDLILVIGEEKYGNKFLIKKLSIREINRSIN